MSLRCSRGFFYKAWVELPCTSKQYCFEPAPKMNSYTMRHGEILSRGSYKRLLERSIFNVQAIGDRKIPQGLLKRAIITFQSLADRANH